MGYGKPFDFRNSPRLNPATASEDFINRCAELVTAGTYAIWDRSIHEDVIVRVTRSETYIRAKCDRYGEVYVKQLREPKRSGMSAHTREYDSRWANYVD